MNNEDLNKVVNSFITFDEMYDRLKIGDISVISRKLGTNEYPQINWLIDYFIEKEEYEKCEFLKNIKLPRVTNNTLNNEINKYINIKQ
jgi:hypothetical protein